MFKLTPFRTLGIVGVVVIGITGVVVSGQDQTPPTSALGQLLAEVRGLRAEVTAVSSASIRAQLLVGRLQLQEQRIAALGRQLSEVQTELIDVEQNQQGQEAVVGRLKAMLDSGNAEERSLAEREIEATTLALEQDARRTARLRAQESSLLNLIDGEQARWSDFNGRLDELEQSLGR